MRAHLIVYILASIVLWKNTKLKVAKSNLELEVRLFHHDFMDELFGVR